MKDRMKSVFDSRATWGMIGAFVGSMFGEPWTTVANALGVIVQAVL